jgi:Response regulator containing CheY-like receiver, AAA-type ATPase, and DNA-binding domains
MKLILIEDFQQDAELCKTAINDFNEDNHCVIDLKIATDVSSAKTALKSSHYDFAIIDMKLADNGNEGNEILKEIKSQLRRIPVVIMSGTPHDADTKDIPLLATFAKGDIEYYEIIKYLWDIYQTGLTKIMGGKGEIEKSLNKIFIKNIVPLFSYDDKINNNWIKYAQENPEYTERSMLRLILNYLIHDSYKDENICYPEEMYIHLDSSMKQNINTGCILQSKSNQKLYIVLTPACDLVQRNNKDCKTETAVLAEIQKIERIKEFEGVNPAEEEKLNNKQKDNLNKIRKNNKNLYYHWLPGTAFYTNGAVVNFRLINSFYEDELNENFDKPVIQISSHFLKDIISRFSSYYSRQGQPDIFYKK